MHTYLLYGQSPIDGPPSMDPLTLHQSTPPVALPARSKDGTAVGGADGQDEHLWARRQFSVLWAPMPSDGTAVKQQAVCDTFYYLALNLNSHASRSPLSLVSRFLCSVLICLQIDDGSLGGLPSPFLLPYRMDAIQETEQERLSPFSL